MNGIYEDNKDAVVEGANGIQEEITVAELGMNEMQFDNKDASVEGMNEMEFNNRDAGVEGMNEMKFNSSDVVVKGINNPS